MEKKNFRFDIEGLRGIAILLVVAYHSIIPGFSGGFIGVDVFFVLSGYLITGLLIAENEKHGTISLKNFYSRRARRLLPALFIAITCALACTYVIYAPFEQTGVFITGISASLYSSNIYFLIESTNYLADAPYKNPFLHTWSLSVEEQFYFVFPLIVLLAYKLGKRKALLISMAVVMGVSFILCLALTYYRQPWAFFSSPARAWEFAAGALSATITRNGNQKTGSVTGWIGLLLIISGAILFNDKTFFPGFAAILPVIGTVAVLRAGHLTSAGKFLSNAVLQFFGRLSYSWYLWHWIILVFAVALREDISLLGRFGCTLLSLGIALASYVLIEKPVRFNSILTRHPAYGLVMAGILTLTGASICFTLYRFAEINEIQPEQMIFTGAIQPPQKFEACSAGIYESELKECQYGDLRSDKTVVLIGDSHLYQWFLPISRIAGKENWHLVTLFKDACSPVQVSYFYRNVGRRYTECEQWREKAYDRVEQIHPFLVIIGGFERVSLTNQSESISLETWIEGLEQTFDNLGRSGSKVVYMRDTPHIKFNPLICLARRRWQSRWVNTDGACQFERSAALNDELAIAESAAAERKHVSYIDMDKYICSDKICDSARDRTTTI